MTKTRTRLAPPRAGAMLESLRGLGYSTATAVADIIDNAISATATQVDIRFEWSGDESWISVTDDGHGMNDSELELAMHLGAKDPRHDRGSTDLGRFGMGLKTASFSQARRLTVASKKINGEFSCLRWDLEAMEQSVSGDWLLYEGAAEGSEFRLSSLEKHHSGTVVLWELLDRVVTKGFSPDDFMDVSDAVEQHVAMTFHRLLDGASPCLTIRLNGRSIKPWDPFLRGHPGKRLESMDYRLKGNSEVTVKCHVLPHKDRLSAKEFEVAAGPAGWMSQQGFYIYRNNRLLACAGWLRLSDRGRQWTRDEAHRLARISIDIPNSADVDWKINILKSTATPPVAIRKQLVRLAADTRAVARSVFAHRGRLVESGDTRTDSLPDAWVAKKGAAGTSYRIARDHALVRSVLERAGPLANDINAVLRLIETTVPVQRIWLDTAENDEPPEDCTEAENENELLDILLAYYDALVNSSGLSPEEARRRLARTSPFDRRPDMVEALEYKDKNS